MLKNYLTIALRVVLKNKVFSIINILGLATGIACCILIVLFIEDELSFEQGFRDHEKIFRINTTFLNEENTETSPFASPPIAPGLATVLPEIERATRVMAPLNTEINIVTPGARTFFERKAFLVDSTFLDVFEYKLAEGDPERALDAPSTVLISEDFAKKIFGSQSALDELLVISSGEAVDTFRVTGVLAARMMPSHMDAELYMNMNSAAGRWILDEDTWADNNIVGSYVKLHDPGSSAAVEKKMATILDKHAGEILKQSGRKKVLSLQPIDRIRLYSDMRSDQTHGILYVSVIATVGGLILLLASINFMNLTTARSSQRANEVGIRKAMGAQRKALVRQFLGESSIIVLFALISALVIVALTLPAFNTLVEKSLAFTSRNIPFIAGASVLIAIGTAVMAGSYPAFFMSSLKPTEIMKGKSGPTGRQWLRKGLIVFQFATTITLISGIFIIQKQLSFIQSKTLGFDPRQVVMIPMRTPQASGQYADLKEVFGTLAGVESISGTTSVPSTPLSTDWLIFKEGWSPDRATAHDIVSIDAEYFSVMNIPLIAGRDFIVGQDNIPGDTINPAKVIVNESSLKTLDIPLSQAIGSTIYFQPGQRRVPFVIVGVAKDFHQFSLHRQIRPMLFVLSGSRRYFSYLTASVNMSRLPETLTEMKTVWDRRVHSAPFESVFLTENLKEQYAAERRTSMMLSICTTIALIISCLGLYGLSVFISERKTKEIGIRKVVGATAGGVVTMLSKDYLKLMLIAFVLSVPIGVFFSKKWLASFAYRIDPGVGIFILSGAVAFTIAWLTISFESIKAARRNPVDSLRSE
jgi:putative ABC transport system permease protein